MEDFNWGAIGAIAGVLGVVVGFISVFKKNNKVNQSVKGLFFSKNKISQEIDKKD